MIRKNIANQTVYLPQLRLTADGSAVTASASLVVAKDGVEAAAAGTLAHYSGGIWKYTPTQAETNCAIMALVLTATGADTVLLNILTTAANPQDATAFGIGNLDGTISSRSSQTSVDTLAGYVDTEVAAIKAKTDNLPVDPADASDIAASFSTVNSTLATIAGYIDTEVAAIKAKTDNLPIDPADASDIAASFASLTSLVNTLTGYVDTEVAAIKAKTDNLPAQPAAVGDIPTANQNRDALLNALPSAGYVDGSFGDRWLISTTDQREVAVTGAHHVAADIHELQPAVIDNTHFAAGAIDANALAADAAAEIANAVADEPLAGHTTAGTLGKVLSDAGSGVTTLLGRITSSVATMFSDLITMITGSGVSPKWSANALSLAPTSTGGGTGTGARTVTITTQLSGAPLEGASVRLTKGAETYVGQTNVSGQLTFNVDDGTWVVSITSPGATFGGASLVVDGPETMTYSLTAISLSPSAPGGVTGYWLCLGVNGLIESGVTMSMQAVEVPEGSTGLALDTTIRTATSNGSGVAQFTDLVPGARYSAWRGTGSKRYITIPEDASGSLELNSLLGSP